MKPLQDKITGAQLKRGSVAAEHVMEFVADVNGVVYVNDSASITVEKVWASLNSMEASVILITGGIDSRNDYSMLAELVQKKVSLVICLGTDNTRIMKGLLGTGIELRAASSVQESVEFACEAAKEGMVVLFSPACPSYHPFDNFKNRGNTFRFAVESLENRKK
jgi:UDP-N-acetylmuramoylalanine--D-glutamate ligase